MMKALKIYFLLVLLAMVVVTSWASLHEGVFPALARAAQDRWFLATLFDCYFAFLAFWLWVAYREARWSLRLLWLVAILCLGNIAMAMYVLIQLWKLPKSASVDDLFRRVKS